MAPPQRSLWSHGDFMRLWLAQTLSLVGSQFGGLALPLVAILVLHASAPEVGLLTGIAGVPWLLIGLFVGVGVDRVRRRPILVAADLGRGLALAWVPVAAALGVLRIEQLYVVAFVVGTCAVFFETAYQSYLPTLVGRESLIEGNSKLAATESIAGVAGPTVAGVVIQFVSAPLAVAVDACSYLLSALSLRGIRRIEPSAGVVAPASGRRPGRGHALPVATSPHPSLRTLERDVHAVLHRVTGRAARLLLQRRRAVGLVAVPLTLALPDHAVVPALIVGLLLHAFGWSLWSVHQGSTRQLLAPDRIRGRVNGSFLFMVRGMTAVGGFVGAGLAAAVGVQTTIVVTVAGALVGSAWLLVPGLIRLRVLATME